MINPLLPNVPQKERLAEILILNKEGIIKKKFLEKNSGGKGLNLTLTAV